MEPLQNISTDTLTQIVNQLVALAAPTKIVLFGSTARGDMHTHSDLDLLIVKKTVKDPYDESLRLGRALRHFMLPIDLVVVSEKIYIDTEIYPVHFTIARKKKVKCFMPNEMHKSPEVGRGNQR